MTMLKLLKRGFTLVETLLAVAILAFCLSGLLATYVNMFFLSDMARDFTLATNAVSGKMEEIKKENFSNLYAKRGTFNLTDYGFPSPDSKGLVEVEENFSGYTGELTRIRILAFFKSRNRLIGEDKNFNGNLDNGEDTQVINNRLDSPVEIITLISK